MFGVFVDERLETFFFPLLSFVTVGQLQRNIFRFKTFSTFSNNALLGGFREQLAVKFCRWGLKDPQLNVLKGTLMFRIQATDLFEVHVLY